METKFHLNWATRPYHIDNNSLSETVHCNKFTVNYDIDNDTPYTETVYYNYAITVGHDYVEPHFDNLSIINTNDYYHKRIRFCHSLPVNRSHPLKKYDPNCYNSSAPDWYIYPPIYDFLDEPVRTDIFLL